MGFKSLSLQLLPWCVHLVGGSCISSSPPNKSHNNTSIDKNNKLIIICCDGRMKVYHRPITAAELMREYPRHSVCRSDDCLIGQKVPALPAGEKLQPGRSYFLLPSHLFHSVLSFVAVAATLNNMMMMHHHHHQVSKAKGHQVRPFDIHRTASGTLQIRVSDEFVVQKAKEELELELEQSTSDCSRSSSRVVTSEALVKEYKALVVSRRSDWRPKLESISESCSDDDRRRRVWIRQRFRNAIHLMKHQHQHQQQQQQLIPVS